MHRRSDAQRKISIVGPPPGLGALKESQVNQTTDPGGRRISQASGKRQRFDSSGDDPRMQRPSVTGPPSQGNPTFRKRSMGAGAVDGQRPSAWQGPSLMGMIAGKKFARRLATRFSTTRKTSSIGSGFSWNTRGGASEQRLEPSYRMAPHQKFNPKKVEAVIRETLELRLDDFKYTPRMGQMMSKVLTEEIKENVKALSYDRYRIIACVTLGEKKGQGLRLSSRCTWDEHLDSYATYVHESGDLFCSVTVYGVYFE